jgi:hypothetical protein
VAIGTACTKGRSIGRECTLTNLYNQRSQWPIDTHRDLDAAVALRTASPRISLPPSIVRLKCARILNARGATPVT